MDISERITMEEEELEPILELTPLLVQKRRSQARIILDRFMRNKTAVGGAIFLVLLFLFCFFGPAITGHNHPDKLNLSHTNESPSLLFPFGTDETGRDQMARAMAGGQVSLLVGLTSMLLSLTFGVLIGALAGYYGGIIDNLLMRFTDVFLSIPTYLLLFVLALSLGARGSVTNVILLVSIFGWTQATRLVRGEFLAQKEREYIYAARTIGARGFRLMFRHMLPNAIGPIIVSATLLIGGNIILESVLSYFGYGLQPPQASWGNMVADGQASYDSAPWLVFVPALLILLTVLSCNLVGDGLRDALDPHMTER